MADFGTFIGTVVAAVEVVVAGSEGDTAGDIVVYGRIAGANATAYANAQ